MLYESLILSIIAIVIAAISLVVTLYLNFWSKPKLEIRKTDTYHDGAIVVVFNSGHKTAVITDFEYVYLKNNEVKEAYVEAPDVRCGHAIGEDPRRKESLGIFKACAIEPQEAQF